MAEETEQRKDQNEQTERDYQTYKILLDLWSKENPIKTTKLQVLLAVNALLVSAVNISGGIAANKGMFTLQEPFSVSFGLFR